MLLNLKQKGNVYEQIVAEYLKLINIGAILEGERLPSCRALAKEYGINPNTVEKAYKELIDLGYIESIPKKGFYVKKRGSNDSISFITEELKKIIATGIKQGELIELIEKLYKEVDCND